MRVSPVSTPPHATRARLEAAWIAALTRPEVKSRLEEVGYTELAYGSERFGAEIRRYTETYRQVIQAAGIRVE